MLSVIPVLDFYDFLNKEVKENEKIEEEALKEEDMGTIERLLEELIWIFDLENKENCSISQK